MVRAQRIICGFWVAVALVSPAYGASVALPSEAPYKHLGVETCSSSVCHGSVTPSRTYDVQLNEFVTWSHQDAHSRAFSVLSSPKSRAIASKLGLPNAVTAKVCLDCHADNISAEKRGPKFTLSEGVSCEACHGGAERWLQTHTSRKVTYRENITQGMYPTADLPERAHLCLSCHYGTADKFATHRIMAAGHPRLSFELETFLSLQPPHYRVDDNYRRRKPSYSRTQMWAYGQLAAAAHELDALEGPRITNSSAFPELALFNCYGCHMSSMKRTDWGHRLFGVASEPGTVPVSQGSLCMAWIISRQLDPAAAPGLLKTSQSLLAASASGRQQIAAESRQVDAIVERLLDKAAGRSWSHTDERQLLNTLISVGSNGEYRDYIDAEQAVMGIDGLLIELNGAARYRSNLDELYALVQNDEAYDPEKFVVALRKLQSAVDKGPRL